MGLSHGNSGLEVVATADIVNLGWRKFDMSLYEELGIWVTFSKWIMRMRTFIYLVVVAAC